MGGVGVFLCYGWFEAFWDAFGEGHELFVVVLRSSGTMQAVFPCWRSNSSQEEPVNSTIGSLTNEHSCYYDFIVEPETRSEALSCFTGVLRQIAPDHEVLLEYLSLSENNPEQLIRNLRHIGNPVHAYSQPWAPWIELSGNWETFHRSLSGHMKGNLRRYRSKAEKIDPLHLEIVHDTDKLAPILDRLFEIENRNWKGHDGTAIKSRPDVERFYRHLASWALKDGRLLLFFLKLGEMPIAASFCLHSNGTVFQLKFGYDESFAPLSPGSLLQEDMVKYLFQTPEFQQYNFLGSCDAWKMRWTQSVGSYGFMRIYPRSLKGWGRYMHQYGWKNFLKQFMTVRRLRAWIGSGGSKDRGR